MKNSYKLIIAALLGGLAAGCFWNTPANNGGAAENSAVNTAPAANETADGGAPPKETVKMEEIYPVASYSQETPTATMRTYIMATVNKDVPTVTGLLSKGSLQMVENAAKEQGRTAGEVLTAGAVENKSKKIPEFRNEKISGNTATVEYKDETMPEFLTMPLVKEDGQWKIALDVFRENLIKKLTEDMNKPAPKKPKQ